MGTTGHRRPTTLSANRMYTLEKSHWMQGAMTGMKHDSARNQGQEWGDEGDEGGGGEGRRFVYVRCSYLARTNGFVQEIRSRDIHGRLHLGCQSTWRRGVQGPTCAAQTPVPGHQLAWSQWHSQPRTCQR